ncbi:type II toxin-antitoxin system prevent-host-death family antitoxin [Nonomuraea sp. NPDC050643]|uniref:type II toxin-antitoxin system prevent-host-death family antitoxin n=1 Tax=Nonomuraea sp. NPDC050643 TaxID=3155660 RepID=UPI0033F636ED
MIDSERSAYHELEARFGPPLGVEDARARWGSLVSAAENGTTTLITRERWEWAALVPMSEVPGLLSGLPVLSLSTARAKLGELVRQTAQPYDEGPLLLTRHRTPVVALVAARRLLARLAPRHQPVAEKLLSEGQSITLTLGPQDEITAIARDRDGTVTAAASGPDIAEALRKLHG